MKKNEITFMNFDQPYHKSKIVYFGAPFDGTASFKKGAINGPKAIREDSYGLENYSPYQDLDIKYNSRVIDIGDLKLAGLGTKEVLDKIYDFTVILVGDNKIPFMTGGEHLVSFPVVRALKEKYSDLVIIHFDAHMDLRYNYKGEKFSHATVMRRIYELVGDKAIYQFGIRSGTKKEFEFSRIKCHRQLFSVEGTYKLKDKIGSKPVYVTIDLDVLDPGIFRGTGTQEPGGVTFKELLDSIVKLDGLNIVGADVVELAPDLDTSGVSTSCACKVIREMVLIISKNIKEEIDA